MDKVFLADSFVKSFGRHRVLKTATAWARPGAVTVLLGRNGCGKTTLLRCALGFCRAEQGVVRFDGEHVRRPALWRLARRGLFYVPDRNLLSRRLRLGDQLRLVGSRFEGADPEEAIKRLELGPQLSSRPDDMSGGERRRADLALAFVRRPRCLVADEPLTEIEPKDRSVVLGMFREMAARGAGVLITGHEVRDLLSVADDVIWMTAGTTHGVGTTDEARSHYQFRREYLGSRAD